MKKNTPRSSSKRPTATINVKATEVKKDPPKKGDEKTTSSATKAAGASTASNAKKTNPKSVSGGSTTTKSSAGKNPPGGTPPKAPKAASSSGGGFFSHLMASIIGAVLGIFGLSYASNQNMLPQTVQLGGGTSKQLNMLAGRVGSLEVQTSSNDVNSITNRLAHLNERLDKTQAGLGGGKQGAPTLVQKIARLETILADLETAARTGKGGKLAGLTAVTKQLKKSNKQTLALNGEFIKLREAQTSFREDLTSLRSAQADFRTTSAKISNEIAAIRNANAKMVADASRPPDVSAQIKPVIAMLGDLTAKIDGVLGREAGSKAEGRNIALALSLGELKRAVNEGAPYKAELARVQPHAPKSLDLAILTQYANKGIVTHTALRSEFSSVSNKALASEHTAKSGSFMDQLMANAKSMVQVRPTGLVEGETTGAVLSRMEYKLDRDDLSGALKESGALQGSAKDVMQSWVAKARSRVNGDMVLRALEDKIRNSLAGSKPKAKG